MVGFQLRVGLFFVFPSSFLCDGAARYISCIPFSLFGIICFGLFIKKEKKNFLGFSFSSGAYWCFGFFLKIFIYHMYMEGAPHIWCLLGHFYGYQKEENGGMLDEI